MGVIFAALGIVYVGYGYKAGDIFSTTHEKTEISEGLILLVLSLASKVIYSSVPKSSIELQELHRYTGLGMLMTNQLIAVKNLTS